MAKKKKEASETYQVKISINALQNIDEITGYIAFIEQQSSNATKVEDALFDTLTESGRILMLSGNRKNFQRK
ncbi:MAG: hypothetical protein M3342_00020 [Bacteroidota bacterium]|nr:hypothetical protein [Bacteroidota bacterium]